MPTNEQITGSLAAALIAAGYEPKTATEWVISAINYLHSESSTPDSGGDIKSDGSVNFTGKETFNNGLATPKIEGVSQQMIIGTEANPVAGADNTITVDSTPPAPTCDVAFHDISLGDLNGTGNSTAAIFSDSTSVASFSHRHFRPRLDDYPNEAAAIADGKVSGDVYRTGADLKVVL